MAIEAHLGNGGPAWPSVKVYDAPFWSKEVLFPGNPRRDPYNQPFMDEQLGAASPADMMWKDALVYTSRQDKLRMRGAARFGGPVAHAAEEIQLLDGIVGRELNEFGELGAISTACRNHITAFNLAWPLCAVFPASAIPGTGACREIAKGGLRTSARAIGSECVAAAEEAIRAVSGVAPPAPPPPVSEPKDSTLKTIAIAGGAVAGVLALAWLLK